MEQDSVDLSLESLSEADMKLHEMGNSSIVNTNNTMTMATTGRYNLGPTGTSTHATLRAHGRPVEIKPFEVNPDMAMLEDASSPYNIDPETLSNLWVVRFGKEWVGSDTVEDDEQVEFWRHAANRLRELGYLEMHTLASSYRVVLRIVE